MFFFGLINYENYLLETMIKSKYSKNLLLVMYLYMISGIIKFHIALILCYYFEIKIYTTNILIIFYNLISPIFINIVLSVLSNTIYGYVSTHKPYYESHIDFIIANYSKQNLILWKRKCILCICIYILLSTLIITIDNYLIFISTIQTAISFIVCDFIENPENLKILTKKVFKDENLIVKNLNIIFDNINQYIFPRVYYKNNKIIDNYMSPIVISKINKKNNNIIEPLSLDDDKTEQLESHIFNIIKIKSLDNIYQIDEKPKTPPSVVHPVHINTT